MSNLGRTTPDLLPTVGVIFSIVDGKTLEIRSALEKTNNGGNLIRTTSSTSTGFERKIFFCTYYAWLSRIAQMAWLHAVRFPWSGLRCGIPFTTGSQGFPETWLDIKMQKLLYQTSTPVFRSNCFFNNLLRCRAPTTIQKTLGKVRIQFRKFVCCIVGPPPRTNWSAQWHDILHGWNMRVDH